MMQEIPGLHRGKDGVLRCWWCGDDPLYQAYHDQEWGRPVHDEVRLFEKICLETFQSGLSWLTILRKRPHFRAAFADFSAEKVASFGPPEVEALMANAGIIRNRRKIEAAITNARAVCALHERGESLVDFFWSRQPPEAERPRECSYEEIRQLTETPTSRMISRELKQRGFVFVGPVTMYAHMQAMGLVNDHVAGCQYRPG